jgi:hypothetical protein
MTQGKKNAIVFFVFAAFFTYFFLGFFPSKTFVSAKTCTCLYYEYYDCPGNAGCKDTYKCKVGVCKRCGAQKCEDDPPPCHPFTCADYTRGCGLPVQTLANGCGGNISCPATVACATPTPTPIPACVDSDGGNVPGVAGSVTTRHPAPAQTLTDSCLTLKTTQNADGSSSSQWISGTSGTHVGEKTCVSTVTGAYADTVYACQYGCANGACNSATSCGLRNRGDANCDNVINDADYAIWKTKMQGGAYASTSYSADYNKDGAVTIVDHEIWRMNRFN